MEFESNDVIIMRFALYVSPSDVMLGMCNMNVCVCVCGAHALSKMGTSK